MRKLRKWDPVVVVSGKHKGAVSKIEKVSGDLVYLDGVNVVKKAMKGQGFVKKTLPLHISNVAYYLSEEKKPTRIAIETTKSGNRVRRAVKTWKIID